MTYQDLISILVNEIREQRSWPANASGDKLTEQIRIVYGATLVAADSLPLYQISDSKTTSDLTATDKADYKSFDFPQDVFFTREDLGIINLTIDGKIYTLDESVDDIYDFRDIAGNFWQKGETVFYTDLSARTILSTGEECTMNFVAVFSDPSDNADIEFPLPKPYDQQVVELAAMHVEAVLNGNTSKSSVHNALVKLYGENYA